VMAPVVGFVREASHVPRQPVFVRGP
jgi:hypothetical protein